MLFILVHVNQPVFFFLSFVNNYIFCYFLAWGLVSASILSVCREKGVVIYLVGDNLVLL